MDRVRWLRSSHVVGDLIKELYFESALFKLSFPFHNVAQTPLMIAAYFGRLNCMQWLVETRRADLTKLDSEGNSVFHVFLSNPNPVTLQVLFFFLRLRFVQCSRLLSIW
jgi:hypothetical protein